jgi:hypothetical protein
MPGLKGHAQGLKGHAQYGLKGLKGQAERTCKARLKGRD